MSAFGHVVDGIDASPNAVNHCRAVTEGGERYEVSTLADWRTNHLYDVVFSIDVMFHIMDDEEWEASVVNLARMVRLGGRLLLADHSAEEDHMWSSYQKTRARSRYIDLVTALGFSDRGFRPNGDPRDPVGLHDFGRVA